MAWRVLLLVVEAVLGVTALAGGIALALGPRLGSLGIVPPPEYLQGTPFGSYLVPGLVLLLVVGGTQVGAFLLLLRRAAWAVAAAGVAGCGMLIWVFVQMVFIPYSPLQAVYFGGGLAELLLALLLLDVLRPRWR